MKRTIKIAIVAIISFLSVASKAQNNIADSLAKQGDILMNRSLPSIYQPQKGFGLYVQAANLGSAKAMNALGLCYKIGLGTTVNQQTAMQWFNKAANAGYAKAWYNLGMGYKEKQDFENAFQNISNGASQNDPQSIYAKGYMLYKGLGCTQDYTQAAKLFAQGVAIGKPNSIYFYGLCLRNGYGVTQNTDSAKYWLLQASNMGYKMASDELAISTPENAIIAGTLAQKLQAAHATMLTRKVANQYQKVENRVEGNEVAGTYTGYLLKYDWSGVHPIEANKLTVTLAYDKDSLTGIWNEDDSLSVPIHASLASNAIAFNQMKYSKTNHYSLKRELTVFKNATLQLDKIGDSVYLSGNIQQFIPNRNEPSKPLYLALVRTKLDNSKLVSQELLKAYPNPFNNIINIDFELKETCTVSTQIVTLEGKVIYSNLAGTLAAGSYTLPIQTQQIAAGNYLLMLKYGKNIKTTKVLKF